jgi:hypothetical protein
MCFCDPTAVLASLSSGTLTLHRSRRVSGLQGPSRKGNGATDHVGISQFGPCWSPNADRLLGHNRTVLQQRPNTKRSADFSLMAKGVDDLTRTPTVVVIHRSDWVAPALTAIEHRVGMVDDEQLLPEIPPLAPGLKRFMLLLASISQTRADPTAN